MNVIKDKLRQMALSPQKQLRRLALGTVGSVTSMLFLFLTSAQESAILFYFLSTILVVCVIYALPGYIGIWVWRMRKSLFNLD